VFYESHSTSSRDFLVNQLGPAYEWLRDYISLDLVPFGHVFKDPIHNEFHCQHGAAECYADRAQACVIDAAPNDTIRFKYVRCMMVHSGNTLVNKAAQECLELTPSLSWDTISKCVDGPKGKQLTEACFQKKTMVVNPSRDAL